MKLRKTGDSIKILAAGLFIITIIASVSCTSKTTGNRKDTTTGTKVSDAERRGIERAEADIKNGDLKILYYGERCPADDNPRYDRETGLRMINEEWDDLPSNDYPEEVAAYNRTIRAYMKNKGH